MGKRFVLHTLLLAFLALAAVGTFNYRVDPFQQYRIPKTYAPRFYQAFQRHENPGIARHYDYDRVVIGSSMTENVSGSEVDKAFGSGRTVNLALSAMTAHDARRLLEVVLGRGKAKQVLYTLDFNAFSGAVDRTGFPEALPTYLYDRHRWNDLPYLLSMATARRSLDIVRDAKEGRFSTDSDRPWAWDAGAEFSAARTVANLDPANLNARFRQPPRTLEGMLASFEANLATLVDAHPEVEFVFIWPPYSVLVWADFAQRGQLEVTLDFKRRFFARLGGKPNVRIHDFQAREAVINDLGLYTDIYHYGPPVSSDLIRGVAANEERVTAANLEAGQERLRAIATSVDPHALVAAARSKSPESPLK